MTINALEGHPNHHEEVDTKVTFGFWVYIMTDFILFASLFATYAVLRHSTYGGPGIAQVMNLHYILTQTLILLVSAFTFGLVAVALQNLNQSKVVLWTVVTIILGGVFLAMQWCDYAHLVQSGISWKNSAFLSSYFTLGGVYMAHLFIALLWSVILLIQLKMQGLNFRMKTRFTCLSMFWNFLNIIWLLIFTIVYLMGAL